MDRKVNWVEVGEPKPKRQYTWKPIGEAKRKQYTWIPIGDGGEVENEEADKDETNTEAKANKPQG